MPPEVLFDSVCALFESALCPPCCSKQDAVAPVTKDIDQVSTLTELYFMFDLLEFDIDNIFSQSGERFVFYLYFMPRLWLLIRNPNWSFHKFSVWLVKSIRIPICDALVQNSNCFQITIGCITLSAVINVLGYMLLVVFYLEMSAILSLLPGWLAAILVSAILVPAILDNRYNGNISILVRLLLRF